MNWNEFETYLVLGSFFILGQLTNPWLFLIISTAYMAGKLHGFKQLAHDKTIKISKL